MYTPYIHLHMIIIIGLLGASQKNPGGRYCRSKPRQGHLLSDTRDSQSPWAISLSPSGPGRALGRQPEDWRYFRQHSESISSSPSLPPSSLYSDTPEIRTIIINVALLSQLLRKVLLLTQGYLLLSGCVLCLPTKLNWNTAWSFHEVVPKQNSNTREISFCWQDSP